VAAVAIVVGAGVEVGSGSRMSAPSPRPKAFLGICNYLLGKLRIALCPFAMQIVEDYRLPKTWRFRQPHVARNHALKDLSAKKAPQIRGHLPGKRSSLVVHR